MKHLHELRRPARIADLEKEQETDDSQAEVEGDSQASHTSSQSDQGDDGEEGEAEEQAEEEMHDAGSGREARGRWV